MCCILPSSLPSSSLNAWLKQLAPPSLCRSLPAFDKLHSLLTAAGEELPDCPLYLNLHDVCKTLRATVPRSDVFRSALVNAGYRWAGWGVAGCRCRCRCRE